MAENGGSEDQPPEEVTIKDLWRHISGMEGRLRGEIHGVESRLEAKMDAGFEKLTEEADVIRKGMLELASHEDFRELKAEIAEVRNDGRLTRQEVRDTKAEVSRLRADVKSAGIPVR